ncbi:MAG: four helix bundle protein [Bacteroidales bacterium]|nr:four helix bundle protein [Bacteroidales bacterium]
MICKAIYRNPLNKVSIALKEANETKLWIRLLRECNYITIEEENSLLDDCHRIIKILVSIVNKVSKSLNK